MTTCFNANESQRILNGVDFPESHFLAMSIMHSLVTFDIYADVSGVESGILRSNSFTNLSVRLVNPLKIHVEMKRNHVSNGVTAPQNTFYELDDLDDVVFERFVSEGEFRGRLTNVFKASLGSGFLHVVFSEVLITEI